MGDSVRRRVEAALGLRPHRRGQPKEWHHTIRGQGVLTRATETAVAAWLGDPDTESLPAVVLAARDRAVKATERDVVAADLLAEAAVKRADPNTDRATAEAVAVALEAAAARLARPVGEAKDEGSGVAVEPVRRAEGVNRGDLA